MQVPPGSRMWPKRSRVRFFPVGRSSCPMTRATYRLRSLRLGRNRSDLRSKGPARQPAPDDACGLSARVSRVRVRKSIGRHRRQTAASRPVIVLIRKPAFIDDELAAGLHTLAFRVPDEPFARAFSNAAGRSPAPRQSSRAGHPISAMKTCLCFHPADLLVAHGPVPYAVESSIIDLSGARPRLLREGAVSESRFAALLGPIERPSVKVRTQLL